jgi:hypothetical protein
MPECIYKLNLRNSLTRKSGIHAGFAVNHGNYLNQQAAKPQNPI